jgi:diguanylate cyclase (GGDEF)-like protein
MVDRFPSKLWSRGIRFREKTTARAHGGLPRRAATAEKRVEHLEQLTDIDELTNLLSRRGLMRKLEEQMMTRYGAEGEKRSSDSELAVVFIDLDNFKKVNDRLGHHIGDKLLVDFSQSLRKNLREKDIVARYGGDEMVLVLPVSGEDDLREVLFTRKDDEGRNMSVMELLRSDLPKLDVKYGFSVGYSMVVQSEVNSLGGMDAFKIAATRADQMMYTDKRRKRPLVKKLLGLS